MNFYDDKEVAGDFMEFLNSENGKVQKRVVLECLVSHLPQNLNAHILDAACGTGWLAGSLFSKGFSSVRGFDASDALIAEARENFPEINFEVADAAASLPYQAREFDYVILNMASHDLEDQPRAFGNFYNILKPGGVLLVTMANPYYSFPVGVWKRSVLGKLLRLKPKLLLRPYNFFKKKSSNAFRWNKQLTSRFYPLPMQINNFLSAGFNFAHMQELESQTDSPRFNSEYQLYRFPLILFFKFQKPGE